MPVLSPFGSQLWLAKPWIPLPRANNEDCLTRKQQIKIKTEKKLLGSAKIYFLTQFLKI